jgi:hypothetical protein
MYGQKAVQTLIARVTPALLIHLPRNPVIFLKKNLLFTFTLRTVTGYIAGIATQYYDRKVVGYDGKSRISSADRV